MAELLGLVGIADPERRLDEYPFQLSGGMKQRVMIAIALAGDPQVLIADEPTTALDVTIQAQVLDLLAELQARRGMGMLLITHDLGVVARMEDGVAEDTIRDGDLLAVHRTTEVRNGQIVVARLDDDVTVKRFRQHGAIVELVAENPDFAPIVIDTRERTVEIEGIAVGLIRGGEAM